MTELLRPTARECVSGFIVARLGEHGARPRPLSVGLAGPQGSGKTRLLQELEGDLCQRGLSATALSLDDFYLTRAERQELSRQLHPLFMTRGVPGTHDVAWLERVLLELGQGDGATWPRFDKAADDRCPRAAWHRAEKGRVDVVLLEGLVPWPATTNGGGARRTPKPARARV